MMYIIQNVQIEHAPNKFCPYLDELRTETECLIGEKVSLEEVFLITDIINEPLVEVFLTYKECE